MTDPRPVPRPMDTPEESRQLDRYYMIGLVCMAVLIVAFPIYKMGEPDRRARTQEAMRSENVTLGASMFAQHCAACHGDDARGGRGFPTLGAKEFLTSVTDRQLQWLIAGGIPGSAMTAYDMDLGGPFTAQEITRLVAYLRSLEDGAPSVTGWYTGALAPARAIAVPPQPAASSPSTTTTDADSLPSANDSLRIAARDDSVQSGPRELAQLFVSRCAACHAALGEGTPIAARVRPLSAILAANPDSAFGIVARGVSGTAMMPFAKAYGGPLDETVIRALVSWMRESPDP